MYNLYFRRIKMSSIMSFQCGYLKKSVFFIIGLIGFIIGFFFKEAYIIVIMMKSHKFIACFKSQKSLREGLLKEEFFEEVMDKIKE